MAFLDLYSNTSANADELYSGIYSPQKNSNQELFTHGNQKIHFLHLLINRSILKGCFLNALDNNRIDAT